MPKVYNADTNEWEEPKGKGSTPASNTRKKMKAAKAAKPKSKKKAKAAKAPVPKDKPKKAPVPVKRSVKDKVRVPSQAVADQAAKGKKLKGKTADLPSKNKKKGHGIAMGKYKLK